MTNETLVHEGITYRKVNRKAKIGDKVLITSIDLTSYDTPCFSEGNVYEVSKTFTDCVYLEGCSDEAYDKEYVVLEEAAEQPIADSDELTLTEADVRNNPRQVIDLIANLALRLTKAENAIERLDKRIDDEAFLSDEWADEIDDRIDRLASANEQAVSTVARNVETWSYEMETLRREIAKVNERTQPYQQAHELFVKIAEGSKAKELPKPKTFDFAQLSGKTLKIETGYDIADGLVCSTTVGYDEEDGKRYVLDSKVTAINFHTGLNAEERREL